MKALPLLCLLVLTVLSLVDAASDRLHVSGLTIRLASTTEKDGLSFTGKYPSTILNAQELNTDTELIVSFKVTDGDEMDEALLPQQSFLMFQSKAIDVATYIVAHAKEGKLMASTDVKYLLQQLGGQTLVELTLIVGDPRFPDGIFWNLGTLKMDPALLKDSATAEPMLPRRLHESQLKPEIQHLFREPDARPPVVVSLFFAVLCWCPFIGWLRYVQTLGINVRGLPSASSRIWVWLFHTGLAMILALYALFFSLLNLIQMIIPLSCLCLFCFLTGHQALCAVAGTIGKEKTA